MFLLDFLNGFEIIDCEDYDTDYKEVCYKQVGCSGCTQIYDETKYGDDRWESSIFKHSTCSKKHLLITVKIVLPSKLRNIYDKHGILKHKYVYYNNEHYVAFRIDMEPSKVVHEQEKCEEIVETRTQCSTVELDGPPEGYD